LQCIELRENLQTFGPRIDRSVAEMVPHLLLEMALRGLIPPGQEVTWEHGAPQLTSVAIGGTLLAPARATGLRFSSDHLAAVRGAADLARVPLDRAGLQRTLAGNGNSAGFRFEQRYRRVGKVSHFATIDHNPIAEFEAHPEKDGNHIDLGGRSEEEWAGMLDESFALIERFLPGEFAEMGLLLHEIIPVGYDAVRHLSASYREVIGTIYLTLHPNVMTMTEAVIHEFQHNKVNVGSYSADYLINAFEPQYHSPIRPDPRPLWGILLAVHAFLPVAELYRRMRDGGHPLAALPEFDRRLSEIDSKNHEGMEMLRAHGLLTPAGRLMIDELETLERRHLADRSARDLNATPSKVARPPTFKSAQQNLLRQCRDAIGRGHFDVAFEHAEQLLDLDPTTEVYGRLLRPVDSFVDAGDRLQMYELLQQLERDGRSADGPWHLLFRFALLERLGWYNEAFAVSADFKTLPPRYRWMCYARALTLMNYRRANDEARQEVEIALQATPNLWKTRATLAECALCQGREGEAFAIMDDCIARLATEGVPGEQDDAVIWRGELRLWLGQYDAAIADLAAGVERKVPYALIWSGAAHFLLGDHGRALELLDEAVRLNPSDPEAYLWRGEVHEQSGNVDRAIDDFDCSLRMTGMTLWLLVGRALTNAHRGDLAATISDFRALPPHVTSFFEWKVGTRVEGDPQAAVTVLRKMREEALGIRRAEQYLEVLWMKRT